MPSELGGLKFEFGHGGEAPKPSSPPSSPPSFRLGKCIPALANASSVEKIKLGREATTNALHDFFCSQQTQQREQLATLSVALVFERTANPRDAVSLTQRQLELAVKAQLRRFRIRILVLRDGGISAVVRLIDGRNHVAFLSHPRASVVTQQPDVSKPLMAAVAMWFLNRSLAWPLEELRGAHTSETPVSPGDCIRPLIAVGRLLESAIADKIGKPEGESELRKQLSGLEQTVQKQLAAFKLGQPLSDVIGHITSIRASAAKTFFTTCKKGKLIVSDSICERACCELLGGQVTPSTEFWPSELLVSILQKELGDWLTASDVEHYIVENLPYAIGNADPHKHSKRRDVIKNLHIAPKVRQGLFSSGEYASSLSANPESPFWKHLGEELLQRASTPLRVGDWVLRRDKRKVVAKPTPDAEDLAVLPGTTGA